MSRDLYAEARALAGELADAGHSEWERRIHNAIAGGATATEILMALRWTLSEMLLRDEGIRDSLRDNASRLKNELDQALWVAPPRCEWAIQMTENSTDETVDRLVRLLSRAGEDRLAQVFSQIGVELLGAKTETERQSAIRRLLALYSGGAGGFLDYVLQNQNGVLPSLVVGSLSTLR